MEILIAIAWIAIAIVRIGFHEREAVAGEQRQGTLCRTCANSHMVMGFSGKELISCTFGGTLRPMKFEVRECTRFTSRLVTISPVRIEGFVREKNEVYAKVRIA